MIRGEELGIIFKFLVYIYVLVFKLRNRGDKDWMLWFSFLVYGFRCEKYMIFYGKIIIEINYSL